MITRQGCGETLCVITAIEPVHAVNANEEAVVYDSSDQNLRPISC